MTGTDFIKQFEEKLSSKTSWGRNEVISLAKDLLITEVEVQENVLVYDLVDFVEWMAKKKFTDEVKGKLYREAFPEHEDVEFVEIHFDENGDFSLRRRYK